MLRAHDKAPTWGGDTVDERLRICLQFLESCGLISADELNLLERRNDTVHGKRTSRTDTEQVFSGRLYEDEKGGVQG